MFTAANYNVYFKHHKANAKNSTPRGTTCTIVRNEAVVAKASSKPIPQIPVKLNKNESLDFFGKRLKKVHRLDDGTRIAILSGDNFSYATGRKVALTKALEVGNIPRNERKAIWKRYKEVCK